MELFIGKQIRDFRKAKNLTQEQLADLIGVSFQAVSKWENNIAFPDITLIPKLAQLLGVSIDELFDYSSSEIEKEIELICTRSYECREANPEKGREIIEEGLKKYPDNDILLNNLLYCLDYSHNPDETISVATKLIGKTKHSDVKYDALRFLAYAYSAKGEKENARTALEQIPEIYFTKLSEMAFILDGDAKYEAAKKQKWISFETLLQMMWKLAECYEEDGENQKAIEETQKALAIIEIITKEEKTENFKPYKEYFKKQIKRMKE
ncbi:MAG: helix-turn-helix transcriptional regulator [Clostridia bacterium]|nr:helix-turn-helix transcriptional regulator [Clostridia bacterium]